MTRWNDRFRRSSDDRLELELRDHIERQIADLVAAGVREPDARRRVRLEHGGLDQATEACRDVRPFQWLNEMTRDVSLGFRGLAKHRFFATAVIAILALGIGFSVAIFSILTAVVLRDLPYARSHELAVLTTHLMEQNRPDGTSGPNLLDWRSQTKTFADITFFRRTSVSTVTYIGGDGTKRAQEGLVASNFFSVLGTRPLVGRTFSDDEFSRGNRVVVLSEGLWQDQFGRSASAIGRTLTIDGERHLVIGVMPRQFQLPTSDTRFWRPMSVLKEYETAMSPVARDGDLFEVIGRLTSGALLEDARAEMSLIAARLRQAHPVNRNLDVRIVPLAEHVIGTRNKRGVWLAFTAVLSLLAIACANVVGLLSVRALHRRRELAVRSALGAGRLRLLRQLLAENVPLWAVASTAGVLLARTLIGLVGVYGPALPRIEQVSLDAVAVGGAFLGGFIIVTLCGTIPAMIASRPDGSAAFSIRHGSGFPRGRAQDVLATAQIGGTVVLLIGALLFAQSFLRAAGEDPGYPAGNVVTVRFDLPRAGYPDGATVAAFFHQVESRVGRLPGVVAVGAMTDFFLRRNADQRVTIERPSSNFDDAPPRLSIESVTPGFFRAAGIPLIEGRDFDERDLQPGAARVFIVNQALAQRFWPGESALGKRMVSGRRPRADGRWDTVIGVVRDMRREALDVAPILSAFSPEYLRNMDLTIRTQTAAASLIPAIRAELRTIDGSLPLTQISTAESRLAQRLSGRRFESQVLAIFATMALLLSAAGLYGLLAYRVVSRTRELAIRSALGATRAEIVGLILRKGARLSCAGVAAGLVAAVGAAQLARRAEAAGANTLSRNKFGTLAITSFSSRKPMNDFVVRPWREDSCSRLLPWRPPVMPWPPRSC